MNFITFAALIGLIKADGHNVNPMDVAVSGIPPFTR